MNLLLSLLLCPSVSGPKSFVADNRTGKDGELEEVLEDSLDLS